VLGQLSRSLSGPSAAGVSNAQASISVLPPTVTVEVRATEPVHLVVRTEDRVEFDNVLQEGEGRSWVGNTRIEIQLERGGVASVTVNGHSLGKPGTEDAPYSATFFPGSYRGQGAKKSP
jgi:hypothetical protein